MTSQTGQGASRRLIVIGPSATGVRTLRGALITDVKAHGHQVHVLTPRVDGHDVLALDALGAGVATLHLKPDGFSLWPARAVLKKLAAGIAGIAPHAVLADGASLVPLVASAAVRARVPRIAVSLSDRDGGPLPSPVCRALKDAHVIIAHNAEDERAVAKIDGANGKILRLPGAGADLDGFGALPLPPVTGEIVFAMAAPLIKNNGVLEFCEAAHKLMTEGAAARFVLAGTFGPGADALSPDVLARYSGAVTYAGPGDDLKALLAGVHVAVSASYREDMPYTVLQALAAGRPAIVTDIPGSRETVDEMVNGTLFPARDSAALADAFRRILKRKDLIPAMARASRSKAERHFAQSAVNAALIAALELT